jgi:hypothetical protein
MQLAEDKVEAIQEPQLDSGQSRRIFYRPNALGKNGQLIWIFLLIDKVKYGHFQSASKSREGFQCWDRVPILHARDVVTKQTRSLLHVHLRKRFVFAQRTQSLADDQFGPLRFAEL